MKLQPLYIPQDKRDFGCKVYCRKCDTLVFDICKETNLPLQECPYGEEHFFKAVIYEKNSGKRRTKNFITRLWRKALVESAIFKKETKEGNRVEQKFHPVYTKERDNTDSITLINAFALYIAHISGENKHAHRKSRVRSEQHRNEVENVFTDFILTLKKNRYPVKELAVSEIDDEHISLYHQALESRKRSPRTYDKKIGILKAAFNYFIKENYLRRNPFSGIAIQAKSKEVPIVTKDELEKIE